MNTWLDDVPGATEGVQKIVALGRVGEAADIADAVAFFTTPDSRWVTGQVLEVNGGLYLGPRAPLHH
jgi:3-oxoacyl-[acyl-carrier protein] reductase